MKEKLNMYSNDDFIAEPEISNLQLMSDNDCDERYCINHLGCYFEEPDSEIIHLIEEHLKR